MKKKLTTGQKRRSKIILGIVETQLRENNPPETRQTLERLTAEGFSREQALELIGIVVASEIFDVMKQQEKFDQQRFVQRLNDLPTLPEE